MKNALVTGGAGFIGSQLVRELEDRGYAVTVLDKLTYAGERRNLAGTKARLIQGDICDAAFVHGLFKQNTFGSVFHLAADSHVARSFNDAQKFLQTNVCGTEIMLNYAHIAGVQRFLHVSTDEVLGDVLTGCANEDAPLKPRNPYAASKAAAEMVVSSYRQFRAYPVKMVRLSNCYGPRQHTEKLIPATISRLLAGEPAQIHGTGRQIRDWLHVSDAARGIIAVSEDAAPGSTYHLPGDCERPVGAVVEELVAALGGEIVFGDDRPGGNDRRYGMTGTRARRDLGWRPKADFVTALRQTAQWYKDRLKVPA